MVGDLGKEKRNVYAAVPLAKFQIVIGRVQWLSMVMNLVPNAGCVLVLLFLGGQLGKRRSNVLQISRFLRISS